MGPKGDRTIAFCGTVEAVYPALTNAQARMPWRDATLRWQGYCFLLVLQYLPNWQLKEVTQRHRGAENVCVPSPPWLRGSCDGRVGNKR